MKCATTTRFPTIPADTCIGLVLSLGILSGLLPGMSARAGTHRRLHAKAAAQPKKHRNEKHATSPPAPAPISITTATPVPNAATPQATVALVPAPTPPTDPSPAPAATAGDVAAPLASPESSAALIEEQIYTLTNQVREANDLGTLTLDDGLTQAAQIQASAMAMLDTLNHTLPGMPQPTLASRLQFVGYNYSWAAENIAFGASDAAGVFALWMSSPAHQENILSPDATATGVAVAYDSQGVLYFCQVFGEPQ